MTEGKKGRRRKEPKPGIDLEGIGTMNFAEVRGTSMAHGSIQVMCAWRSESCVNSALPAERPGTSAGHEVWAWPGQGRAGQSDRCGFWTRATLNPRKFFFFLLVLGDRSTSRLAVMKLACVRSHFHITQPDRPGG